MVLHADAIVDIPPNRVRYFGTTGKMLLPCPATVAALIQRIPEHKLITTDLLRQKLTADFDVEGTCPITTQKALRAVAHDAGETVAYWRVLKKNGQLIASFPGGVEGHAERLQGEGFTIDTSGKVPVVSAYQDNMVHYGD
jgi:hypothetical protein